MRYWQQTDNSSYSPFGMPQRQAPVVRGLIILCVAVFLLQTLGKLLHFLTPMVEWFSLSRDGVFGHGFVWQLVTYAFLHYDILHILFNMLVLYWFGREIELLWGSRRFLLFYLTAAAFAGLLFALTDYLFSPRMAHSCLGASGAIMALMMAYALYWPDRVMLFMFLFPMRMRTFIIIITVIQIVMLADISQGSGGVAIMAHLGGLLYGFLIVRGIPLLRRLPGTFTGIRLSDPEADQRRLDQLLEKIHGEGIQSLSWREKRFLKRMSERK